MNVNVQSFKDPKIVKCSSMHRLHCINHEGVKSLIVWQISTQCCVIPSICNSLMNEPGETPTGKPGSSHIKEPCKVKSRGCKNSQKQGTLKPYDEITIKSWPPILKMSPTHCKAWGEHYHEPNHTQIMRWTRGRILSTNNRSYWCKVSPPLKA
jgi:hypothetical protein